MATNPQVLLDQPLRHGMHGNEPDLAPLAPDPKMHHALTALHVPDPQPAQLLAAHAVIEQGARMARSRTPLSVSPGGASSSLRAGASPSACVLPSLPLAIGRLTPST
jgi:hypothetical protein